ELSPERRETTRADILARVRAAPGIVAAATTSVVPITGESWNHRVTDAAKEASEGTNAFFSRVSPGWFATLGTPIVAGRDFGPEDKQGGAVVALVNQTLARKIFGGDNPVGRRLRMAPSSAGPAWTVDIVGEVADTKYLDVREEFQPLVYVAAT